MGRKTHLPLAIVLALLVCTLCVPALGADVEGTDAPARTFFSSQLNPNAHAIYERLSAAFADGDLKDGIANVDITGVVPAAMIKGYAEDGERQLFIDFSAAKDAFDLEHPEAWYVDSSFLCLRVGKVDGAYQALIGPGRSDTYYLNGQDGFADASGRRTTFDADEVDEMDKALKGDLDALVDKVEDVTRGSNESDESLETRRIKAAHDAIVRTISYRFENECAPEHSLFVRTIYGARTHEGVCEAYARTLQYVLNQVDIPCILMSGLQTSGDSPEQHMWCAVRVNDVWYGVDPTWDDPIKATSPDSLEQSAENPGEDGAERTTYLLAGTGTMANWVPNGVFSADGFEFTYPEISQSDYVGGEVYANAGLTVNYSSAAEMEGVPAGAYIVRYDGGSIMEAGRKGHHLLVRQHYAGDAGKNSFDEWYYVEAGIYTSRHGGMENQFFNDDGHRLIVVTPSCDYVEFALTDKTPEGYDTWSNSNWQENELSDPENNHVYYEGTPEELICQTGHLENVNSDYRPNPYVYLQLPAATSRTDTGSHIAKVMFDDALTFDSARKDILANKLDKVKVKSDPDHIEYVDSETMTGEDGFEYLIRVPETEAQLLSGAKYDQSDPDVRIKVSYLQKNYRGEDVDYELQGDVNYDENEDGYIDADTPHLNWLYECNVDYPHRHVPYGYEGPGEGCRLVGVEFEFEPSTKWADDLTYYQFQIEGLVGSDSGTQANPWGYLVCDPVCPMAYRSQGIDWSLWGRPNLLDNPGDLNLGNVALHGVDDKSSVTLEELQRQMNLERLDGRLMLVAEDLSAMSNSAADELTNKLEDELGGTGEILGSSMYEINFSNICKKTISEVKDGDSMRVQVGFPEGYGASSNVVFKAYHFTRDADGKIDRVEEIPVIVTEYGLLVLCDSFSPFEMVAMSPEAAMALDQEGDSDVERYDECVVVASDGHVKVQVDGKDATSGAPSIVSLAGGASRTFTLVPDKGYQVQDAVLGGGLCSLADADNGAKRLTISVSDLRDSLVSEADATASSLNAILSVSSVPTSVALRDAEEGFEEVTPVPGDPIATDPTEDPGTEVPGDPDGPEDGGASDESAKGPSGNVMEVYRLYNPNSGEHFFTHSEAERDELAGNGWTDEGVAWYSPLDSGSAVYRLRNPFTDEHHYTPALLEVQDLVRLGWSFEGFAWRNGPEDSNTVYRLFNPYLDGPGAHHYTTSAEEYEALGEQGWIQEGTAWQAFASS